jgi:peptidoglycan/xylan/chitin deacetylase (PgdA/CDA1 family)
MQIANRTFSPHAALIIRSLGFVFTIAAIWGGYFWWRPPAPLLGLKCITRLPYGSNQIALTFDDGPHPLTTPLLLAALRRADVEATFFVVGEGLKHYPQLAARIHQEGHRFGNHSEDHHNLTRISPDDFSTEVDEGFASIERAGQTTRLFRPPGGGLNHAAIAYLYRNHKTLGWWSNNVGDWAPQPAWQIVYEVLGGLRPGDILLLHDAGTSTPQALPMLVREARKRGLEFVLMPEPSDNF